jgi:ribosomal protein S18 acetylase RimI-like enzyme
MLSIKKYADTDLVQLKIAFEEIFDKAELPYFDEFVNTDLSYIAINRSGEVGAFILVSETEEAIGKHEINFLGVLPRYRRRGYAKSLIDKVKLYANQGLWLNVMETNMEACKLYETNGFTIARRFNGETGEAGVKYIYGLKCYYCSKELKPDEVILEETPTNLKFGSNGFVQEYSLVRSCWRCCTRIEP